jgi:hypothetical protein
MDVVPRNSPRWVNFVTLPVRRWVLVSTDPPVPRGGQSETKIEFSSLLTATAYGWLHIAGNPWGTLVISMPARIARNTQQHTGDEHAFTAGDG